MAAKPQNAITARVIGMPEVTSVPVEKSSVPNDTRHGLAQLCTVKQADDLDHSVLDEDVPQAGADADDRQRHREPLHAAIATDGCHQQDDGQRVHEDALEPAPPAGDPVLAELAHEQAAGGGGDGHQRGQRQLDSIQRAEEAHAGDRGDQSRRHHQHRAGHRDDRKDREDVVQGADRVVRHSPIVAHDHENVLAGCCP